MASVLREESLPKSGSRSIAHGITDPPFLVRVSGLFGTNGNASHLEMQQQRVPPLAPLELVCLGSRGKL